MFGLLNVPYEVLANIVGNIDFDDVFNLALTCKELKFLIVEESICKSILQSKIKYSNEALAAVSAGGGNARALRRAAKRRQALATVDPFTVTTIGFCDAYIYNKGVLCYTVDDRVRILDLHNSGDHELVISIPALLTAAISDIQDNSRGTFQILYYSDRIISCVYRSSGPDPTAWLIAFSIRHRIVLFAEELESTEKIFVRHNREFLYFGTNSDVGTDGHKKWVIQGYSFRFKKWFEQKMHLSDLVGSEIGSTVVFELHKKYFYALSNQTSFEVEEIDWTSFYHCQRFPLDSPCKDLLEKTKNEHMWRRQHQEGPIDDRWTFLRLDTDESTGDLQIVESRKEWYLGASRSQRTYYKTPIVFQSEDPEFISVPGAGGASSSSVDLDNSLLPASQLLLLRKKDDNPHYLEAPPRDPHFTHPGNDGSTQSYSLAKTRVRSYHTASSTFLDLIDDPDPDDWRCTQRLCLRGSSRSLKPPLKSESGLYRSPPEDLGIALQELYHHEPIRIFPRPFHPPEISKLLNPPTHLGNVQGTMDERSMVYVTGPADQPQALIYISFDAGCKLKGLKRWGKKGVGEGPHIDGRATGNGQEGGLAGERDVGIDRKGKGRAVEEGTFISVPGGREVDLSTTKATRAGRWAWKETAMYRDIGLGFTFDWAPGDGGEV